MILLSIFIQCLRVKKLNWISILILCEQITVFLYMWPKFYRKLLPVRPWSRTQRTWDQALVLAYGTDVKLERVTWLKSHGTLIDFRKKSHFSNLLKVHQVINTTRVSSVPFFKLKIPRGQVLQNKKKFLTSYLNFKIILDFLNLRFLSIKTLQDTFFQFFFLFNKISV